MNFAIFLVMNLYNKKDWMGVVLCGGKSSSFGVDKGLLRVADKELVLHCYSFLYTTIPNVVLSVNDKQFPLYKRKFNDLELVVDSNQVKGPLSGILSVYSAYRVFNFIVTTYDRMGLHQQMIKDLMGQFEKNPGYDFYVYKRNDKIEPFCGLYTSSGLEKVYNLYNQGVLMGKSLREVIQNSNTMVVPIKLEYQDSFDVYEEKFRIA
jgi:molybdopterin-guanine dinucleotide biosynthesis protein A